MSDRRCLEKVDDLCRDLIGVADVPFGGLVVLASGDLRQTLPVVKQGSRAAVVAATIVSSPLWPLLTKHRLSDNMRVRRLLIDGDEQRAQELQQYADWLLSVGDGTSGKILRIPPTMLLPPPSRNLPGLIRYVFGDLTADGALLPDRQADGPSDHDAAQQTRGGDQPPRHEAAADHWTDLLQRGLHHGLCLPASATPAWSSPPSG